MPHKFTADSFHTKKLYSGLSSKEIDVYMRNSHFAFLSPHLRGLEAAYDVHLRLIGKCKVDFLSVITELFLLDVAADAATSEYRLEGVGHFGPKFQAVRGHPPQPFFMSQNYMHRSFIWYKNVDRSFFRFVTIHAFDRQTDRFSLQDIGCIAAAWYKLCPMAAETCMLPPPVCEIWTIHHRHTEPTNIHYQVNLQQNLTSSLKVTGNFFF